MFAKITPIDNQFPQELEYDYPVVNIGSHPENDIVVSGPGVLPFHAALHVQNGHYTLVALGNLSAISVDCVPLKTTPLKLNPQQQLQFGAVIIDLRSNANPNHIQVTLSRAAELPQPAGTMAAQPAQPTFEGENPILVNVLAGQAEVEVGQTAFFELEIINGGPIVANFLVSIEGVPADWVEIAPSTVNLYEGQHALVQIKVTPPREPDSKAGAHKLSAGVISLNYGGQRVQTDLELLIRPYYEFNLGSLSPRHQRIYWRKRSGVVQLPITNQGNSPADFNVSAYDEENGCSFDFEVSRGVERSRQAVLPIPAGQSVSLPVQITPLKRPVAALRNRSYHYTATVQVAQQAALSQTVSGTATSIPLIGWWTIVLTALLLLVGLFFLFQPNIYAYDVAAAKDVIELGDTTRLEWKVSPFATRLSLSNVEQAVTYGQTSLTIAPTQSTTYELVAGNWLSGLLGLDQRQVQTVLVVPPSPKINTFEVDSTRVDKGVPLSVRWSVTKATKAFLTIDQVVYELAGDKRSGEQSVVLEKDALVTLDAQNASGNELRSYYINVVPPNITVRAFTIWVKAAAVAATQEGGIVLAAHKTVKKDTPPDSNFPEKYVELVTDYTSDTGYRVQFYQEARELSKGEQVMLEWNVDGVEKLQIAPFTEPLPNKGLQPFFPQESMNFVMTAKSGELENLYMLPVKVFDGEPPVAPKIEFFKASPTKYAGAVDVQFAWSVSGEWTRVQLSTEEKAVADYLNAQGFKTITVDTSSTYILTAWNGSLSSAAPVEITIDPTLIQVPIKITDVLPVDQTQFHINETATVKVAFVNLPKDKPRPTGKIVVTDGVGTCDIGLPADGCVLTFKSPGNPAKITASYLGDSIYSQSDSAAFTGRKIIVEPLKALIQPSYAYSVGGTSIPDITTPRFSLEDQININIKIQGVGGVLPQDKKGQVALRICDQDPTQKAAINCEGPIAQKTVEVNTLGEGVAVLENITLRKAGKRVLQLTYLHSDNVIEKTEYFEYNIVVAKTPLVLRQSICTLSNTPPYDGCLLGVVDPMNAPMTFDILKSDLTPLPTTLPAPLSADFRFSLLDSAGLPLRDWACEVIKVAATSSYTLDCQVDLGTATPARIQYAYSNTTSVNYSVGADATRDYSHIFNLAYRYAVEITLDSSKMENVAAGREVVFTSATPQDQTAAIKLTYADNIKTPINSGTERISLTVTDAGLRIGNILRPAPGTSCFLSSDNATLVITSIASPCTAYFTALGTYHLQAFVERSTQRDQDTGTGLATVIASSVGLTWQNFSGSSYVNWNVPSLNRNVSLPVRIIFVPPAGADFELFSLQTNPVRISFDATNGSCTLATSGRSTAGNTGSLDIPPTVTGAVASLEITIQCDTARNLVTLSAAFVNTAFTVLPAERARNFYVVTPGAPVLGAPQMSVRFARVDGTNIPASITHLYVGEEYKLNVTIGRLWADSNVRILNSIEYYITNTYIDITLPAGLYDRVHPDVLYSTCPRVGNNTVRVRLDRYNVLWNSNSLESSGASDIEIYNTECSLYFTVGEDVTFTNQSVLFSSDVTVPYYGGSTSFNQTYATEGLTKQTVNIAFTPTLPGTGWVNSPINHTVTVGPGGGTHKPFEGVSSNFSAYLTIDPSNGGVSCASISNTAINAAMTGGTFTLTPTRECTTGQIRYRYQGNDWFYETGEVSSGVTMDFHNQRVTTVSTPAATPAAPTYGQTVSLSATVTAAGATPTGTVAFSEGGSTICSATLVGGAPGSASASCSTPGYLAAASHSILATYTPDTGEFTGGASASSLNLVVNPARPTLVVTAPDPAGIYTVGNALTFTASVSGTPLTPPGTVEFRNAANILLCADTDGTISPTASCSHTPMAAGTLLVTAHYLPPAGNLNYVTAASSSISLTINRAIPTITLTSTPAFPATLTVRTAITFTAEVTGTALLGEPNGTVTFQNGATILCSNVALSGSPRRATCAYTPNAAGALTVTAEYVPGATSNYATVISAAAGFTINRATPTVTLSSTPASPATVNVGTTVDFSAEVTGLAAPYEPTGSVEFRTGAITLCSATLSGSPRRANCSSTTLAAGAHNVTALYQPGGDLYHNSSSSAGSLSITVRHTTNLSTVEYLTASGPPEAWSATFPFNTSSNRAVRSIAYDFRVRVNDADSGHGANIPSGDVEIWLQQGTNPLLNTNNYTITTRAGDPVTYLAGRNHYSLPVNASGYAEFTITFLPGSPGANLTLHFQFMTNTVDFFNQSTVQNTAAFRVEDATPTATPTATATSTSTPTPTPTPTLTPTETSTPTPTPSPTTAPIYWGGR